MCAHVQQSLEHSTDRRRLIKALHIAHDNEHPLHQQQMLDADPDRAVDFTLPNGMAFAMQAHEYCRDWATPQFYFHLMAAYAILRAEGLAIGKIDYVGYMMKYLKQPA